MKDPEIIHLITQLQTRTDLSIAEFDGVVGALRFLVPDALEGGDPTPERISTTDGAMVVADQAFPNWVVHIHGRANDRDGHWHCTLRETDARDNDSAIGSGRSPVLAQAVLAAVLHLSMILSKKSPSS